MTTIRLTEQFPCEEELCVEASRRLVGNVALAGRRSRNGYEYTVESLEAAVDLYNGKPVYLDHSTDRQRTGERSPRDLVGAIENARFENDRIRGDIRVVDTETGRMFLGLVASRTPGVGMSHVVLAERSRDGQRVERIEEVISVDVVMNPATTSTFKESCRPGASLENGEAAEERMAAIEREKAALQERVRDLEHQLAQRTREVTALTLLAESGLPSEAVSRCFREQLLSAATPQACRSLIEDRLALLPPARLSGTPQAHSMERAAAGLLSDELFVAALRGRA